jgi:LAS superfamily LD-carboxypeptidase LdcB
VGKEPIRRHAGFLGSARVSLDRRKPEGREEPIPVFDAEPRRKRRSADLLGPTRRRRWRGGRLVVIFALVSLFGVGYSFPPEQETARSVINSSMHSDTPSRPSAAGSERSAIRSDEASLGQEAKEKVLAQRLSAPAENCGELRVMVDRSHSLPPDYVPEDLVPLRAYRVPTLGSEVLQLRRDAAEHLERLVEVAAVDGEELVVSSAYRSYEEQQVSHERLVSVYGSRRADAMSAAPGHSQHQLGTAVDFTNSSASYQVWLPFGETTAYWWLEHHAREYGFVQAYPRGKEEETGYRWEPWHYRYVGVENAQRLQDSGLSLQEFLEREGIMPNC